jgi:glyoxylase-like metal-dependent hydrolase (beta-lactamase superfamily II)
MLTEVADGVWVQQSEWVWTNAVVVRGDGGLVLVDPGIDGSELSQLADDLDRLGVPVVAGFCTHPHWDHLLWHPRFGDVPRYATAAGARVAFEDREQAQAMAARSVSGIPLELIGLVTPLPADGGPVPGEIVEHSAHAVGHAAVLLADRGVLLAGDMLSDILIPLLDRQQPDQVGAYKTALDQLDEAARRVHVVVPGHALSPRVLRSRPASLPIMPTLRRSSGERNQSTRGWDRKPTGSSAPINPTWSKLERGELLLTRDQRDPGARPVSHERTRRTDRSHLRRGSVRRATPLWRPNLSQPTIPAKRLNGRHGCCRRIGEVSVSWPPWRQSGQRFAVGCGCSERRLP